ncbi:MAG: DUF6491 family protein [Pseudomonadales bacterium]
MWKIATLLLLLAFAGCAASPEAEQRSRQAEEDVAAILSQPLDAEEYGETRRCLMSAQYHNIRILDDQRVVFEGTGNKLWLNQLRGRCPDLRAGQALRFRSRIDLGRICDLDHFEVVDWFDWPWYRHWPWDRWSGMSCTLGPFQPVTEAQVDAIRDALKAR